MTANADSDTVSVLLNRGDGSFRAKRDYRTEGQPTAVAIGDLSGDGKPGLVTTSFLWDTIFILGKRGDGSFQSQLGYATGYHPLSVAIGDVNGDGRPDLVTANLRANTVSVLLNKPGLCTVQDVIGLKPAIAKRTLARANCRVGKVRRAYSWRKKGRVVSQKPRDGTVLPGGGKVNLVVSRGRRHS